MTDEQKQRKLEANRAYRERQRLKKSQEQPSFESISKQTPQELAIKVAKTHGLPVFESTPNPDLESAWKRVQPGKIEPLSKEQLAEYVSNREKAEAILADSTARFEYVNHLFAKYEKSTNLPELLRGLIKEQIETRIVMIDILAEILNEVRK